MGWNHLSCSADGPKMKGLVKRPNGKAIFPLIFNFTNHVVQCPTFSKHTSTFRGKPCPIIPFMILKPFSASIHTTDTPKSIASTSAGYTCTYYAIILLSTFSKEYQVRYPTWQIAWTDCIQRTWKESTRDWTLGQEITSSFGIKTQPKVDWIPEEWLSIRWVEVTTLRTNNWIPTDAIRGKFSSSV